MNWENITPAQFEDLCCKYANTNYKEFTWIPTARTRDGNKDGEFSEEIESIHHLYKGWYESKFTKYPEQSIPYAHMDSTLVSGILDGQVVYILFMTNGRITREFKRRANAILQPHRIEVNFVDGELLEEWICKNPDIYNFFFDKYNGENTYVASIKLAFEDVCFFDGILHAPILATPLNILVTDSEYYIYLGIKSNTATECTIKLSTGCLAFCNENIHDIKRFLQIGYNSFFIKCRTRCSYKGKLKLSVSVPNDKQTIFWEIKEFIIKDEYIPKIIYAQQTSILQQMYEYIQPECSDNTLLGICGCEGSGKSYLIRKLLESLSKEHNECLMLQFSEKKAENASILCKLVLFLNFGHLSDLSENAFSELISSNINLSLELFKELKSGSKNQIAALNAIQKLIILFKKNNSYAILPNYNFFFHNHIAYIFIDDLQKLNKEYSEIFQYIIEEFVNRKFSQILICGYRPKEFQDIRIEKVINGLCQKKWFLGQLTPNDIYCTISQEFGFRIGDLSSLFPYPINVLHLILLIKNLKKKSIQHKPNDKIATCFADAYNEVNAQNNHFMRTKLANSSYKEIIYLIYKIETGISKELLINFWGDSFNQIYSELKEQNIIKEIDKKIIPFHDAYLYTFKNSPDNDKKYLYIINKFLKFISNLKTRDAVLESTIISILLDEDITTNEFRNNAIIFCRYYYSNSEYSAAKYLAKALLPDLDIVEYNQFNYQSLELLYIYAQCIKSTTSHLESTKLFHTLLSISRMIDLTPTERTIELDTISEILNNELWLLNFSEVEKCLSVLQNLELSLGTSVYKVNAYLNYLNRKMMYEAFIADDNYLLNYQKALKESDCLDRNDYKAYAMMDYAKIIYITNPQESISLLERAKSIFSTNNKFCRRLLDCEAELVFLNTILYNHDFEHLYILQKNMLSKGYIHSYAKTNIKILSIELINGISSPRDIEKRLNRLTIQNPDLIDNKRLCIYYYQLKAALCYLQQEEHDCRDYLNKQLSIVSKLAPSYNLNPRHNLLLKPTDKNIIWKFQNSISQSSFWLDPRLW